MNSFKLERRGIAILISILVFILLLVTAPNIGLTWDEPAYIAASESYMDWYGQVFTDSTEAFRECFLSPTLREKRALTTEITERTEIF